MEGGLRAELITPGYSRCGTRGRLHLTEEVSAAEAAQVDCEPSASTAPAGRLQRTSHKRSHPARPSAPQHHDTLHPFFIFLLSLTATKLDEAGGVGLRLFHQ